MRRKLMFTMNSLINQKNVTDLSEISDWGQVSKFYEFHPVRAMLKLISL
jgi:hypothetical protein